MGLEQYKPDFLNCNLFLQDYEKAAGRGEPRLSKVSVQSCVASPEDRVPAGRISTWIGRRLQPGKSEERPT